MSRRRKPQKRRVLPDPRFRSLLVTELVGVVLKQGEKNVAQSIVYTALEKMDKKIDNSESTLEKFESAIGNIRPHLEVKSRRVGGSTYQVPIEVDPARGRALALRWLVDAARKRSEENMAFKLASELAQAYNSEGNAVRKKVDTHKMADANKAFAHFRW
jgi:small subunit ribosomal protein S7